MRFTDKARCVLLALYLCNGSAAGAEAAFTESVVIFNTICAKCHEAECSGRLSFGDAFDISTGHILRHYGAASGQRWLQQELFEILNYMKGRCAYYPLQLSPSVDRVWEREVLDRLSTKVERHYFVPIGDLIAGRYRLQLVLEGDAKITAQLVSEAFAWVHDECHQSNQGRISIPFLIEAPGKHYFRMYSKAAVRIVRLELIAGTDGG